jgi:hypothetical protein
MRLLRAKASRRPPSAGTASVHRIASHRIASHASARPRCFAIRQRAPSADDRGWAIAIGRPLSMRPADLVDDLCPQPLSASDAGRGALGNSMQMLYMSRRARRAVDRHKARTRHDAPDLSY